MLNKLKKSMVWKYAKLRWPSCLALLFVLLGFCVYIGCNVFGIDFKQAPNADRLLVALALVTVGIILSLVADKRKR